MLITCLEVAASRAAEEALTKAYSWWAPKRDGGQGLLWQTFRAVCRRLYVLTRTYRNLDHAFKNIGCLTSVYYHIISGLYVPPPPREQINFNEGTKTPGCPCYGSVGEDALTDADLSEPFWATVARAWEEYFSSIPPKLRHLRNQERDAINDCVERIQADPRLNKGKFVDTAHSHAKTMAETIFNLEQHLDELKKVQRIERQLFQLRIQWSLRETYQQCANQSGKCHIRYCCPCNSLL